MKTGNGKHSDITNSWRAHQTRHKLLVDKMCSLLWSNDWSRFLQCQLLSSILCFQSVRWSCTLSTWLLYTYWQFEGLTRIQASMNHHLSWILRNCLWSADDKTCQIECSSHPAEHFRREHYLCGHQHCLDQKFVVFQSEQDLKQHNAREHSGTMTRAERRQAMTIPIDIQV